MFDSDVIRIETFRYILGKYGIRMQGVWPDVGEFNIYYNDVSLFEKLHLTHQHLLSGFIMNDAVSDITFGMPTLVGESVRRKYIERSIVSNCNKKSAVEFGYAPMHIKNDKMLVAALNKMFFLMKWSIDFQNSKLLNKCREEWETIPKSRNISGRNQDQKDFISKKVDKIMGQFDILYDDSKPLL